MWLVPLLPAGYLLRWDHHSHQGLKWFRHRLQSVGAKKSISEQEGREAIPCALGNASECRAGLRLLSSPDAAEFCLPGDEEGSQDGKPVLLGPGQSRMQSSPRCLVPKGS